MSLSIYHNKSCKKSRAVLQLLRSKGYEPRVIEYMSDPPARSDLVRLLNQLRLSPKDLMRETEARKLGINRENMELNAALETLARNPKLIERPIVLSQQGGIICHTPEAAERFVSDHAAGYA